MNLQLVHRYILSLSKNELILYEKKNQKEKKKKESNPGTFDTVGLRVFSAISPR